MIGVYNQFNHSHYLPQEFVIDTTPLCSIKENQVRSERTGDQDARIYNAYNQSKDRITQQTNLVDKIAKVLKDDETSDTERSAEVQMRYFNTDSLDVQLSGGCRRCKKPGHYEKWCTEEQTETKAVCRFCLGDHYYLKCPNNLCYKCNQFGHMAKDCIEDGVKCHRCNKRGHKSKECYVIYVNDENVFEMDKQRLKDLICITCRTRGHLNCYSLEFRKFDQLYCPEGKIRDQTNEKQKKHNHRNDSRDYQKDNYKDNYYKGERDGYYNNQRDGYNNKKDNYYKEKQKDNQKDHHSRDNNQRDQKHNYTKNSYNNRNPPNVPLRAVKSIQKQNHYSPVSRSPLSMWSEESPDTKRMNNNRKQKKRKQKKPNKFN